MERLERIEQALRDAFDPVELRVKDQSHLHAGHAGARDGLGHFDGYVVADAFKDVARVRRHQMVYAAMGDMMQTDIHALAIRARAVDE